jgi:LmbE family N-acetylglucosaminyl deacetylase
MRRREMSASAALFGGRVEFLGLEDLFYAYNKHGLDRTLAEWSAAAGGGERLISRFEQILRRERPRLVFTLDPRHGSSCHSGHRAAARLLIEAVRRLPAAERPQVWLEQTDDLGERGADREAVIEGGGYLGWPETAGETVWYDATHGLKNGASAYDYANRVRRAHASQYPDEASGKTVHNPPAAFRKVPLAPLPVSIEADYCTALQLDRPTLDIPGNRERFGIK